MTPKQIDMARHALGFDGRRRGKNYRNHYVIDPGCPDHDDIPF